MHKAAFVEDNDIVYFTLHPLLSENEVLTFTQSLNVFTRSINSDPIPLILAQVQLSEKEVDAVMPMFKNFPDYAPIEEMLVSFDFGYTNVTPKRVEKMRAHVLEMIDTDDWDREVRPMRNILSRTRPKIRRLGFNYVSMLQTGYMLIKSRTSFNVLSMKNVS